MSFRKAGSYCCEKIWEGLRFNKTHRWTFLNLPVLFLGQRCLSFQNNRNYSFNFVAALNIQKFFGDIFARHKFEISMKSSIPVLHTTLTLTFNSNWLRLQEKECVRLISNYKLQITAPQRSQTNKSHEISFKHNVTYQKPSTKWKTFKSFCSLVLEQKPE